MGEASSSGRDSGTVEALQDAIREFARERDWEQFHLPKNLILALTGELGELAELFQWRTLQESDPAALEAETREAVRAELADVFIYLLRLSDVLDVDLADAARHKLALNAERYPVSEVRGSAEKRT